MRATAPSQRGHCGKEKERSRRPAAALRSAVLRFAAMLDLGADKAPPRFVPSFIPFHADLRGPSSSRTQLARELV